MKTIFCLALLLFAPESHTNSKASWYSVKFQSLCDELQRDVAPERVIKHGKLSAYRIRQDTLAPDTVRVSFDFISNCCEEFASKAEVANDTLTLSYYKTNTETCRCICDYRFTYSIADTTKTWSGVKVVHLKNVPKN